FGAEAGDFHLRQLAHRKLFTAHALSLLDEIRCDVVHLEFYDLPRSHVFITSFLDGFDVFRRDVVHPQANQTLRRQAFVFVFVLIFVFLFLFLFVLILVFVFGVLRRDCGECRRGSGFVIGRRQWTRRRHGVRLWRRRYGQRAAQFILQRSNGLLHARQFRLLRGSQGVVHSPFLQRRELVLTGGQLRRRSRDFSSQVRRFCIYRDRIRHGETDSFLRSRLQRGQWPQRKCHCHGQRGFATA